MRVLVLEAVSPATVAEVVAAVRNRGHEVHLGGIAHAGLFDLVVVVDDAGSPTELSTCCRQLRARHGEAHLLALVAAPWNDRVEAALEAGLDDYAPLPFDARCFVLRLRVAERALERRARQRESLESQHRLRLADRWVSMGTLAASTSHEINNPLTYVIANVEFAARLVQATPTGDLNAAAEVRARLRRLLHDAREGAERVRQAVKHLQDLARSDEASQQPIVIEDAIESSIEMAWNEIRHRARLVREFSPVPAVLGNQTRLAQVFFHLLMHTAQAIPEGRVAEHCIRVATREESEHVIIEIGHAVSGGPSELLHGTFAPPFAHYPAEEVVGLGLSVCQGIVATLGGTLEALSSLEKSGNIFRVRLPASPRAPVDDPSQPPHPALPVRRARILLVDDEASLRSSLAQILATEHDVCAVGSGAEAIKLLRRGERYDVLLCDLMMPEMSGIDLFEHIETIDGAQARRVIFLTGGAFTPRAQEFMTRVDNLRLEKPFDLDELLLMIRKVLP